MEAFSGRLKEVRLACMLGHIDSLRTYNSYTNCLDHVDGEILIVA